MPELPSEFILPDADPIKEEEEEEEEDDDDEDNVAETAIAINTALVASSNRNKNLSEHHHRASSSALAKLAAKPSTTHSPAVAPVTAASTPQADGDSEQQRYDYVVDRNYGVEV